jgi:hypothetical protein
MHLFIPRSPRILPSLTAAPRLFTAGTRLFTAAFTIAKNAWLFLAV